MEIIDFATPILRAQAQASCPERHADAQEQEGYPDPASAAHMAPNQTVMRLSGGAHPPPGPGDGCRVEYY